MESTNAISHAGPLSVIRDLRWDQEATLLAVSELASLVPEILSSAHCTQESVTCNIIKRTLKKYPGNKTVVKTKKTYKNMYLHNILTVRTLFLP